MRPNARGMTVDKPAIITAIAVRVLALNRTSDLLIPTNRLMNAIDAMPAQEQKAVLIIVRTCHTS